MDLRTTETVLLSVDVLSRESKLRTSSLLSIAYFLNRYYLYYSAFKELSQDPYDYHMTSSSRSCSKASRPLYVGS